MANKSNKEQNIKIGRLLQTARKSKKVSQEELSAKIGLSKGHMSAVERGTCKGSIELLMGYCEHLHMTPNEILKIDDGEIVEDLKRQLFTIPIDEQEKIVDIIKIIRSIYKRRNN